MVTFVGSRSKVYYSFRVSGMVDASAIAIVSKARVVRKIELGPTVSQRIPPTVVAIIEEIPVTKLLVPS